MSFLLKLSDKAADDIDSIMEYISLDNPLRAESYVDELLEKIRSLVIFPRRCPLAPEGVYRGFELRHLIHGSYRILFTIKGKDIIILRVIHGARVLFEAGQA